MKGQASRSKTADRSDVMATPTIVVLEGDETGQELLVEALQVLQPDVIGMELAFEHYDLSLANRRQTNNDVVHRSATAMKRTGLGLKAATITPEIKGDVGSPNAILRRAPNASSGASAASSPSTHSTRRARRTRKSSADPSAPSSPIYEGMLKEEMDAAAARYPDVHYEPQLIDATYALLKSSAGDAMVIPSLNRDGDCLSDLVMQLFGSIAGAESVPLSFDDSLKPSCVMAEAPHGTAPRLFGKNVANPMAMILAAAALLSHVPDQGAANASRAIYESALETVYAGTATSDLGGHASTSDFTGSVIAKVTAKLEIWASL